VTGEPVPGCPFCAAGRGEPLDTELICEGETWVALFPLEPATPGHTLVIPRRHVEDLWDVDPPLGRDLMDAVLRVGNAIQTALEPDGMNLITSAGRVAEQTVFHLHLHLVPRWRHDRFDRIWPRGKAFQDPGLALKAQQIREECAGH
jgi:histidine triad (HIT) family protein